MASMKNYLNIQLEEMEKKAGNAEGEVSGLRSRLILLQVYPGIGLYPSPCILLRVYLGKRLYPTPGTPRHRAVSISMYTPPGIPR